MKDNREEYHLPKFMLIIPAALAILIAAILLFDLVYLKIDVLKREKQLELAEYAWPEQVEETPAVRAAARTAVPTPIPVKTIEPLYTLDPTPVPTPTPEPTPTPVPEPTKKPTRDTYLIEVNYKAQIVTVYTLDEHGMYDTVVKRIITSSGEKIVCPTGVYRLQSHKRRWISFLDGSFGQYASRITGAFLFHSLPYEKRNDNSSLITKDYYELGRATSGGCMRMMVKDAKWIFENCPPGTRVVIWNGEELDQSVYDSIVQPPLVYENWDPTDPDEKNPAYFDESNATPPPTCCPNVTPAPWKKQRLGQVKLK